MQAGVESVAYINKWQRIQLVRELGLNTEESILIAPGKAMSKTDIAFIASDGEYSLRTFDSSDNGVHPHYPVISQERLLEELPLLRCRGYSCIVAKCINPKDAEFAACAYKRGRSFTIEICDGPVTVRAITHDHNITRTISTGLLQGTNCGDRRIDEAIRVMRGTKLDEVIFEFSWYAKQVGWMPANLIFWEATGAEEKGKINYE